MENFWDYSVWGSLNIIAAIGGLIAVVAMSAIVIGLIINTNKKLKGVKMRRIKKYLINFAPLFCIKIAKSHTINRLFCVICRTFIADFQLMVLCMLS